MNRDEQITTMELGSEKESGIGLSLIEEDVSTYGGVMFNAPPPSDSDLDVELTNAVRKMDRIPEEELEEGSIWDYDAKNDGKVKHVKEDDIETIEEDASHVARVVVSSHHMSPVVDTQPEMGTWTPPVQPQPYWKDWKHPLLDCCSEGAEFCLRGFCCGCFLFGELAEAVGEDKCSYSCIYCLPCLNIVAADSVRSRLRNQLGILGSPGTDCLASCCCLPCSVIQEMSEIQSETPIPKQNSRKQHGVPSSGQRWEHQFGSWTQTDHSAENVPSGGRNMHHQYRVNMDPETGQPGNWQEQHLKHVYAQPLTSPLREPNTGAVVTFQLPIEMSEMPYQRSNQPIFRNPPLNWQTQTSTLPTVQQPSGVGPGMAKPATGGYPQSHSPKLAHNSKMAHSPKLTHNIKPVHSPTQTERVISGSPTSRFQDSGFHDWTVRSANMEVRNHVRPYVGHSHTHGHKHAPGLRRTQAEVFNPRKANMQWF